MKSARILVIEDDETLRRAISDLLSDQGWQIETAADGQQGYDRAMEGRFDLILLDLMLPHIDGYEICQSLRLQSVSTPVLMLTAKGQTDDVVRGLELGADDYVVKPFSLRELLARVRALLRRRDPGVTRHEFGHGCVFDSDSRRFTIRGKCVELTPKEFDLLGYLLASGGRALTRDRLLREVWGNGLFVTERSVDRCVKTLRAKMEDDGLLIQTVRGVGYRWADGN